MIAALDDTNTDVFGAGCAFLRSLLASLAYFQDTSASKLDVSVRVGHAKVPEADAKMFFCCHGLDERNRGLSAGAA